MLRWKNFTTSAYAFGFPAMTNANNVAQHLFDSDIDDGVVYRAWCVDASTLRIHKCDDPSDTSEWSVLDIVDRTTSQTHRPSVCGNYIFYAAGGDIRCSVGVGTFFTFRPSAYDSGDPVALAAVSDSVVHAVYVAVMHTTIIDEDDESLDPYRFTYLELLRVTEGGVETCPHTIVTDRKYSTASLSWFDAEVLGDKDVIVLNERTYGHPVVVTYQDGVWSNPKPMLPQDIVDNYTFLRIGSLSVIDDTLWATGRRGLGGSTGSNAQEYDVVLRSKDGAHWTSDRYSYVCQDNMSGKLVTHNPTSIPGNRYAYYVAGATVKRARQTYLMGDDRTDLKISLEKDILSWDYAQRQPGTAGSGKLIVADQNGVFRRANFDETEMMFVNKDGDLAIHEGMHLTRYAGYGATDTLISTEVIDSINPSFSAGQRSLVVSSRDWALRNLIDWKSSQDWQWLSQCKHLDDCSALTHLYSIGGRTISVYDLNATGVASEIETEYLPDEEENENEGLKYDQYNHVGIFLSTQPFDARNCLVRNRFRYANDSDAPFGLGNSLMLDGEQGTLSITATSFTDSGQNFNAWNRWQIDSDLFEAIYTITVHFSDGSVAWAYLGDLVSSTTINVYRDEGMSTTGWIGSASPETKTPVSYYVSWLPQHNRIGYGGGAICCAVDENNLIAAHFDMIDGKLMILARRGFTIDGGETIGVWLLLASTDVTYTPSQNDLYEVELERDGRHLQARLIRWYDDSSSLAHSVLATVSYDWFLESLMVPGTGFEFGNDPGEPTVHDHGKVGVMANVRVPECHVHVVNMDQIYVARGISDWPNPGDYSDNACPINYPDGRKCYPWWGKQGFTEGTKLYVNGEKMHIFQVTDSDLRGMYYYMYGLFDPEFGMQRTFDGAWGPGEVGTPQCWAPSGTWADDSDGFAWLVKVLDGAGVSGVGKICSYGYEEMGGSRYKSNFHLSDLVSGSNPGILDGDYKACGCAQGGNSLTSNLYSFFMVLPGFKVGRDLIDDELTRGHPNGSRALNHYRDAIYINNVIAYDGEHDKTLEWVLEDVAYKAGVTDFEVDDSISDTITLPDRLTDTGPYWLSDQNDDVIFQRDFDVTVELPSAMSPGDGFITIFRAQSNDDWLVSGSWDVDSRTGLAITTFVDGNGLGAQLLQTNSETGWVSVVKSPYRTCTGAKTIRFVGREQHVAVYADGEWVYTFCTEPVLHDPIDGYDESLTGPGYIGMCYMGATPEVTVRQPELWDWTDGKILDQRMNAAAGLQRIIGDRRIKFQGNPDGSLLITSFRYNRDDIGTQGEILYRDTEAPTDGVLTHVRASGAEICDYVDHEMAARYGLVFAAINTSELEEEAAYIEARKVAMDSLSQSGGRQLLAGGRLDWESEDQMQIVYTPVDGGPAISKYVIVDSVKIQFRPGEMTTSAAVREDVERTRSS